MSTVVVPVAGAVGEADGVDGRELLTAIVAGYEIVTRVGARVPRRYLGARS